MGDAPHARLAAKLRALDRDGDERALLATILASYAESAKPEVEAFGVGVVFPKPDLQLHPKGFEGTDEELQAIIDWLGSLEAQKRGARGSHHRRDAAHSTTPLESCRHRCGDFVTSGGHATSRSC